MDKSIYSYSRYKTYITDRIRQEPQAGRGMRQKLAQAIGCQMAYVSHVLNGDRHFSVEQAEAVTRFLVLGADETEYFVWLVEWERAGTPGAKKLFARLLQQKQNQYLQMKNRVEISEELSDLDKSTYYSSYLYAAIHMLVTIPEFQTPERIARRLNQPIERVSEVIEFLKNRSLIVENRGKLEPTSKYLFIDRNSPFVLQHHTNWRMCALQSIARRSPDDLHLSLAVTLSEKDAKLLRQRTAEFIEEISATIKDSPEEKAMTFNLDFFEI